MYGIYILYVGKLCPTWQYEVSYKHVHAMG
jgi:hypothetical protein